MMKAAEPGTGDHGRSRRRPGLHWPSIRRVFIEGIVNPVVVMEDYVIANEDYGKVAARSPEVLVPEVKEIRRPCGEVARGN